MNDLLKKFLVTSYSKSISNKAQIKSKKATKLKVYTRIIIKSNKETYLISIQINQTIIV